MTRVLITGGSGQIGTALQRFVPDGVEVLAPSSGVLDVSRTGQVGSAFEEFKPNLVINAAAYTAVDRAEADEARAFAINAEGSLLVARACERHGAALIHLSTDYVFDGEKPTAYLESDEPNPVNVYGVTKLAGERAIAESLEEYIILRISWLFGPTGSNFVTTMLGLGGREELRVVDDQRGTPCAAPDVAVVLWKLVQAWSTARLRGIVHFASTPVVTWCGFANQIFDLAVASGRLRSTPRLLPVPSEQYPTPARRPRNSVLDSSRLAGELGFLAPDWRVALNNLMSSR